MKKYYILTWYTKHHSGIWNFLTDTEEEAEKRLRRWIHARYPGQQLMIYHRQIIRC